MTKEIVYVVCLDLVASCAFWMQEFCVMYGEEDKVGGRTLPVPLR